MKTPILIALGALCVTASVASAQTTDKREGVQLKDVPSIGPLFRAPFTTPLPPDYSLFGPTMPPRPKIDPAQRASLKISVLPSPQGDVFQLEAVGQNRAAMLKKITDVMGVRAVIDPQLEKKIVITRVFRGLSWDDLLASINYSVEMVKSPAGTYFFADKAVGTVSPFSLYFDLPVRERAYGDSNLRQDPRFDPFVLPYGGLPAPDIKGWGVEPTPQPGWQKREFNGHEFYYIPSPRQQMR